MQLCPVLRVLFHVKLLQPAGVTRSAAHVSSALPGPCHGRPYRRFFTVAAFAALVHLDQTGWVSTIAAHIPVCKVGNHVESPSPNPYGSLIHSL